MYVYIYVYDMYSVRFILLFSEFYFKLCLYYILETNIKIYYITIRVYIYI